MLVALVLVLITGVVHGLWTERWQRSPDVSAAAARLSYVPGDLGDWRCDPAAADQESLAQAGAEGHWICRYVHRRTGQSVLVVLLCGRADRMSVHRPENCYGGSGYQLVECRLTGSLKGRPRHPGPSS